jgi:hypothetical protein
MSFAGKLMELEIIVLSEISQSHKRQLSPAFSPMCNVVGMKLKGNYCGGTGIGTQGLTLTRQALYHLSHSVSPLIFLFMFDRIYL